jgi:hypothetical protein
MEIARWMLEKEAVIEGRMGRVLADFLIEHLPFEESPDARLHTLRLILYGKLANDETIAKLWRQTRGTPYYLVAFLEFMAEQLPADQPPRADHETARALIGSLANAGNACAERFLSLLSANGQTWLKAVAEILARPSTSLVVYALLDAISRYFHPTGYPIQTDKLDALLAQAAAMSRGDIEAPPDLRALLAAAPQYRQGIEAMLVLSGLTSTTADPWLMRNSAVGALMRRKIEPLVAPINLALQVLRTPAR